VPPGSMQVASRYHALRLIPQAVILRRIAARSADSNKPFSATTEPAGHRWHFEQNASHIDNGHDSPQSENLRGGLGQRGLGFLLHQILIITIKNQFSSLIPSNRAAKKIMKIATATTFSCLASFAVHC